MKFCSNCGNNQLEYKIPEGDHLPRHVCADCSTIHYENPKMVVGCLIIDNGRVMLAKRGIEPRRGYWNLPCGYLENQETVEQGALREVYEETGATVELEHLHTVYNLPHANQVYLIFKAHMLSDYFQTTYESTEVAFFPFEDIPWDQIAFSSNSFAIKRYLDSPEDSGKTHIGSYFKDKIR